MIVRAVMSQIQWDVAPCDTNMALSGVLEDPTNSVLKMGAKFDFGPNTPKFELSRNPKTFFISKTVSCSYLSRVSNERACDGD